MGQQITVVTRLVGDFAVLTGNRSMTGQDSETYASPSSTDGSDSIGSLLAMRLFDEDPDLNHVHVQSNIATLRREGGWDTTSLASAVSTMEMLFVFWDEKAPKAHVPIGGEGRGIQIEAPSSARVAGAVDDAEYLESLRSSHYNATITSITSAHQSLWIIEVTPDLAPPEYHAGQYATLGLGFWEPRVDGYQEKLDEGQDTKLARRSYSISSSILDADNNLLDPDADQFLEFYLVLVKKDWQDTPAILTPRLFNKTVGDRIYLGGKLAGRYRLDKLTNDSNDVLLLATGTGEAPHNRMVLDLLRRGHTGRIVSVCAARYARDLAYLDVHQKLMTMYDNYFYVPMTTREPENEGNKLYIQDLLRSDGLAEALGGPLDPDNLHIFLCGNPAMIGLPEWESDTPRYPREEGAAEILASRGFTIDRRGVAGNVHYEEYW